MLENERLPIPGLDNSKKEHHIQVIQIQEKIMGENNLIANEIRSIFMKKGIYAINLISSPGSGKTTLVVETLKALKGLIKCAVIEGDQQTSNDARRIAETGVPVIQVNTLQSCHLNAAQIKESLDHLPLDEIQLLIIENVGNLVCPAGMDLGENEKIVLMSITEGEDKPAKYPLAFHLAHLLVLTKIDLLPYLHFNLELCKEYAFQVNSSLQILETSSLTREGFQDWIKYLKNRLHD